MGDPIWLSGLLHFLGAVSWPIAVIVLAILFRRAIRDLIRRTRTIKATSAGVELVLNELEKEGPLPMSSRAELSGLSSHDIWALDSFAKGEVTTKVDQMRPAQRVAARTLVDVKLLTLVGENSNKEVTVSPLGRRVLEAAGSLPL
jgi:hypothetical protein